MSAGNHAGRPSPRPILVPSALMVAIALLAGGHAIAGPKDEVKAAMDKFLAAKSYHATMAHSGAQAMTIETDFVAPDRYRMRMPMGTQYIIGDTMVMSIDGRSIKVPMGKGTLTQWRDPGNLAKSQATLTVTGLGSELLDGKPAKKYRMVNAQPQPSESTMWIGGNGYPLQIQVDGKAAGQTGTTTLRYSRFNDPTIRIELPK
ncbi:MAG: hypothetical protein LC715_06365 [Gammaproteobacteria bacterium]|nr:hypothetical protein [Gammaproteobacteria bacterium]